MLFRSCTYASVAVQVDEVSEDEGEPTDKIDIDPPGSPKSGKKPRSSQGGTPTPKPTQATPPSSHLTRAFVVHGVACHGLRRPGRTKSPKVFFPSNMACAGILSPLVQSAHVYIFYKGTSWVIYDYSIYISLI